MPLELQGLSESNMKQFLCARYWIKGISNLFVRWIVNQMSQPHFGSINFIADKQGQAWILLLGNPICVVLPWEEDLRLWYYFISQDSRVTSLYFQIMYKSSIVDVNCSSCFFLVNGHWLSRSWQLLPSQMSQNPQKPLLHLNILIITPGRCKLHCNDFVASYCLHCIWRFGTFAVNMQLFWSNSLIYQQTLKVQALLSV